MKVVVGSDEATPLVEAVAQDLRKRGHEIVLVGPPGGQDIQWTEVGHRVGERVAAGDADTGVLFCWTGTGASMAANKVPGVRAALCWDPQTAAGARKWNDANVLVMSLRSTSPTVASEMLDEWFTTDVDPSEKDNIARLEETPSRAPR